MDSRDPQELAKFEAMAHQWWDPFGKFKPLHLMNPVRLGFITSEIAVHFGRNLSHPRPLEGLRICDIGCGGGLLCEPLARLGAVVVGVDASRTNIEVAKLHATRMGLSIDYRVTTAEDLAQQGEMFDVVISFEVVGHVVDPADFIKSCASLVKTGGLFLGSTLNRTVKSFAAAIIAAEYILRWLPVGTHNWQKFVTPDEFASYIKQADMNHALTRGFIYNPLSRKWHISLTDYAINYAVLATKDH